MGLYYEKLERCPVCDAELDQSEYDFQYHADHWDAVGLRTGRGWNEEPKEKE